MPLQIGKATRYTLWAKDTIADGPFIEHDAPDDGVLLQTHPGAVAALTGIITNRPYLFDGRGGKKVTLSGCRSTSAAKTYVISNFSDVLDELHVVWNPGYPAHGGPRESLVRLHFVKYAHFVDFTSVVWRDAHQRPHKPSMVLRSGGEFVFDGGDFDHDIEIGPNLVDGKIDPHAQPVRAVLFNRCTMPRLPMLKFSREYVGDVLLKDCNVGGHPVKHLQLHSRSRTHFA